MKTLVYRYGLRPPTINGDLVSDQIRAAHRYQNALVELELWRRTEVRALQSAHPDVAPLEERVTELATAREAARIAIKAQRQETRTKSETAGMKQAVKALNEQLKAARAELRAAKTAARADLQLATAIATVNAEATVRGKAARAACGCYWGTYLLIEQAADAARKGLHDPRFQRWDGRGAVGVQIQHGMTVAELLSETDTRLRITPPPHDAPGGKRQRMRTTLRMRVGSDGRDPVWAEWPLIMHRPLPASARVMCAKVLRERVECHDRWSVHLTLRLPDEFQREVCGHGVASVDLGWRKVGEEEYRVAYVIDDTGREEQIILNPEIPPRMQKVSDLRSIRDQVQNEMKERLGAWLRENALPAWLVEATDHLHAWRSPGRFASLALQWREQRFDGDDEPFELLEEWRKQDKHLWTWEANLRDKALARRRDDYRNAAARLARRYHVLVLELFDLRQTQRHIAPEEEGAEIKAARLQQRYAAPSELRSCLIQAFAARGGVVAEIGAQKTTVACASCGKVERWDPIEHLRHACGCGATWDQDANACRNLLSRWGEHLGGAEIPGGARVKDYSVIGEEKGTKWARLKKGNGTARGEVANQAEMQG